MSTGTSPMSGWNHPSATTSFHSKLRLMDMETVTVTSFVSFPLMSKGSLNAAVTTQEPEGMGEVLKMGLGTVMAPGGACPDVV